LADYANLTGIDLTENSFAEKIERSYLPRPFSNYSKNARKLSKNTVRAIGGELAAPARE